MNDNVIGRRRILTTYIDQGTVDERVLAELIPGGVPLPDEDYFWDYKQSLPILTLDGSKEAKDSYAYKMGEIVKDVIAFYNMFGGYLLIGVEDGSKEICGFSESFDVNDLCKKVSGATRATIDLKYRTLSVEVGAGNQVPIGLLMIPKSE